MGTPSKRALEEGLSAARTHAAKLRHRARHHAQGMRARPVIWCRRMAGLDTYSSSSANALGPHGIWRALSTEAAEPGPVVYPLVGNRVCGDTAIDPSTSCPNPGAQQARAFTA
jgi:hypothetical protein